MICLCVYNPIEKKEFLLVRILKRMDPETEYQKIDLDLIVEPTNQVRLEIPQDKVIELAQSISEQGLLQPILVRPLEGKFEIVAGHRRYLACKHLRWSQVTVRIVDIDDTAVALSRAVENLQREDLSPIEEGKIYQDLRDRHNMSYEQIASKMGKTPGTIKRRLDLLKMPPCLVDAVHKRQISPSVAEALWSLKDPTAIDYYLQFAIENGASYRVVQQWVYDYQKAKRAGGSDAVESMSPLPVRELRPVYIACDLCRGPFEMGKETVLRICQDCAQQLEEIIAASKRS